MAVRDEKRRRKGKRREGVGERTSGWSVGGLGYIRKVRVVESRRGAVAKESLTHLPPSWLRPPTPIPCTRPKPSPRPSPSCRSPLVLSLSLSLSLSRPLTLERATPDYTSMPAAACQVACLPACLLTDQVVPNTTKSIYLRYTHSSSYIPPPPPPISSSSPEVPTPILIVARILFVGEGGMDSRRDRCK